LSDVAIMTRLSWDTVKSITKSRLAKEYGKPVLHGVRDLAIDDLNSTAKMITTSGLGLQKLAVNALENGLLFLGERDHAREFE